MELGPQPNVAPLPNEGISYCRIRQVGVWPWNPALLEAGAVEDRCGGTVQKDDCVFVLSPYP